jgi:hypothetical protein
LHESIRRSVHKRKRLGQSQVIGVEEHQDQPLQTRVGLIRTLVPLGLLAVQIMSKEEVMAQAGESYGSGTPLHRYGAIPGSVTLGNQRHPIRISRHRSRAGGEVALANWAALKATSAPDEALLKRILYGLS